MWRPRSFPCRCRGRSAVVRCTAGTWLKEWRRRYFRLIGNKLYFSKDPHVRVGRPRGSRQASGWRRVAFYLAPRLLDATRRAPREPVQEEPHGIVDLKDCLTVKSAEDKTGKRHAFEVATADQVRTTAYFAPPLGHACGAGVIGR